MYASHFVDRSYRPDVDGLRAAAVLGVLIFHYGAAWLPGGFVGVDVFFVISGFLITRNLVARIVDDGLGGRALVLDFYHRRILRIFPAALVMLAIALVAGWWLLIPGDYADLGRSAAAAALGAANWNLYWHTGYFDRDAAMQPLLHMWSLGVEEQFYVVWPLLLALVLWVARGRRGVAAGFVGAIVIGSLAYSLVLVRTNPKAAFYWPDARAWELAAGALLVFLPSLRGRWLPELVRVSGVVLVGISLVTLNAGTPFPGWHAVAPVLGAALLIWPGDRTWTARVLSNRPMVFVGLISYSLYLWHWPLLVFFRYYANGAMPSAAQRLALGLVACAVSWLSWRFVESIRKRNVPAAVAVGTGFATAALVLACGAGLHAANGVPSRLSSPQAAAMRSLDVMWDWPCSQYPRVSGLDSAYCAFGAPWGTSHAKGLLWGDSHAEHMAPIIEAAVGQSMSFLLYRTCPASFGGRVYRLWPEHPNYRNDCEKYRAQAVALLKSDPQIRVVVLAASWMFIPKNAHADGDLGRASGLEMIHAALLDLIDDISMPGRTVVLIGSVPQFPGDPVPCALRGLSLLRAACRPEEAHVSEEYYQQSVGPTNEVLSAVARARPNVVTAFPGAALCKTRTCQDRLDGEFLYRDGSHIRRNLALQTRRDYADLVGLTALLRRLESAWVPLGAQ
jgi:peptidoglycan/LPS O-acetylase OafA/YrhL